MGYILFKGYKSRHDFFRGKNNLEPKNISTMNKIYHIYCKKEEKGQVVNFIENYSNDVLINSTGDQYVGITIQSEEEDSIYKDLVEKIRKRVYAQ